MGVARKRRFLGQKWTPAAAPTPAMQRGQQKVLFFFSGVPFIFKRKIRKVFWENSAVFCCPVMMVNKILGELWKKLFFCKKNALLAKFWPFSPKISFWHSLNGDDFFSPCCDIKISKAPYVPFSKMFWVMPFFITFRSARKKLHVTVFFDHPVLLETRIGCHWWLFRRREGALGRLAWKFKKSWKWYYRLSRKTWKTWDTGVTVLGL